ncbi:Paraquat-inducible protein A [hydrothermal vent metagenome]|uniref:Paraquat-inducible protein A n=1 Tax=hydrothermal vent metagenome TaxID=652676 RepID=A0A1W1EF84_9ZZZZ
MKIKNQNDLDKLIICNNCHTLHEIHAIKDGNSACCTECKSVLYRYDSKLIDRALSLSITGLIFFILANFFPLISLNMLGNEQYISLPETIMALFENGFFLVGILCAFLIFIFPLMVFVINILLYTLLKMKKGKDVTKNLLILLSHISPWSMADIFFISILVALVKLAAFGQIHIGVSLWALMAFVLIDIYITKSINKSELWMLRDKILIKGENKH